MCVSLIIISGTTTIMLHTDAEWAWLAGILDGEGSFTIIKSGYPRITLSMSDESIVSKIAKAFDVNYIRRVDKRNKD